MAEYVVEFLDSGEEIQVEDTETILNAMLESGTSGTEWSCRVGMCLACSYEIVEGEVEQTVVEQRALTEEEAEDYALTCLARPKSDLKLRRGFPPSVEENAYI
ncbi:MAG: 2Fe-2S iron-sulfur cluster-binding protein [Candidatus Nanohaloarchaea archaeon]|nr:2Fe-2S iron-sulfur cluster-binding protein [Candidatus Nanohaloarchaea archaeon]